MTEGTGHTGLFRWCLFSRAMSGDGHSILVRPHSHDEGAARRLQERLLSDHQASLGATLVNQDDHPTLTALRSWGWLDIGEVWRPAGPTMFRALVLPVGERSTAGLDDLARDAWTRWPG
ncbi:hypothetical protein [Streptomyces avermitilis]|uniref:hypothetical protein n=1 Tax=Streptomyces avermitilis TaxID=33903 RepID=UPI00382DDDFC